MKHLSDEQKSIINIQQTSKINALAGTGKTFTLIHYAKEYPNKKILYLSPHRAAIDHFTKGIQYYNLKNTHALTTYAIAKKYIYGDKKINVTANIPYLTIKNIAQPYIKNLNKKHQNLTIYHIQNIINKFCVSEERKIQNFNYLKHLNNNETAFAEKNYDMIMFVAVQLMKQMHELQIPIIHNFYIKLFQNKNPKLLYDIIILDEVQDSIPSFLQTIQNQNTTIIYCGDTNQELFHYKGTVNVFNQLNIPEFTLTINQRFHNKIDQLINSILQWKNTFIYNNAQTQILHGIPPEKKHTKTAFISKSAVTLLHHAIKFIHENNNEPIYFPGGIQSYINHPYGFSILDVLQLKNNQTTNNPFLKNFSYFTLNEFADETNDYIIKNFIKLCNETGNKLSSLIQELEKKCTQYPHQANTFFSTVHKVKSNEFLQVHILPDFIPLDELITKRKNMSREEIVQEINLLYTAISRSTYKLNIPQKYIPIL